MYGGNQTISDLFTYLNSINKKTKIAETPEQFEKDFSPYMINRFMSCEMNFTIVANAMNVNNLSKQMVYDFYFHGIPKNGKFLKYSARKEKAEKDVKYVTDYFGCNPQTAKQYVQLIEADELQKIRDYFEKRGRK